MNNEGDHGDALKVLDSEYRTLMSALTAAWSASLTRTSIFLGVLSAAGVAAGFASQSGVDSGTFVALALVVLPLLFFLGAATFDRLVQIQRESVVYLTGMARIRHFFQQVAPETRPYFVLPAHDDALSLFRGPGTGMSVRPPRHRLLYLVTQTQGIVGVITAAIAGGFGGLVSQWLGGLLPWLVASAVFVVILAGLFYYWMRSLNQVLAAIRPIAPTPADEVDAPF